MIGVGATEMAALLDFMYQGEVNVAQSLLQKFLHTARILQVRKDIVQDIYPLLSLTFNRCVA